MVALPDFERRFSGPPLRSDTGSARPGPGGGRGLVRLGLRLAGVGLITAALGLWVLPSHAADPEMMLVRLLVSIGLFWAGTLGLHAARRPDTRPEVQIDRRAREMRVLSPVPGGAPDVAVLRLDDLLELSLRDGLLSARDRSGNLVVSLDVAHGRGERALRKALCDAL